MNKSRDFYNNNEINKIVKKYLERNILKNDDKKYGYFIINKKDLFNILIINNHSDWFDLYLKLNHQLIDPVVIKSLSHVSDFFWDDKLILASKLALPKVMAQARDYSIVQGHSFVLHDHLQNLVILSIYSDNQTKPFQIDGEKLQSTLAKTHQKMLDLYAEINIDNRKKIGLSKREHEVLSWSGVGKTYKETALILNIKESTVKFHMKNIIEKLGAVNAKHVIKLASELKLIKQINA
ncbi:helix-turn-helix transcriptional regulator [Arsenophonus nasoniae]|uniref:LuxR C-terminal-related transcriptional regulator n=1 Tax=Arsenophonus nasoniae TaxID=638 RepID=A0ABY8NYS2_9GAMM|nr:LuxR family transcriptional regulator [Arsenophonus nasoniae]WGM09202.1 LuxR C-terminal-related transcriptional regulator [Arsenophonus nasoniae]